MRSLYIGLISAVALLICAPFNLARAADEPRIKRAVTPPAAKPGPVEARPLRTQIGLSPLPYKPEPSEPHQEKPAEQGRQAPGFYPDIRGLVKKVNQSVVAIRMLEAGSGFSLSGLGFSGESGSRAMGYGAGFIISNNGHILTNEHVLRNGTQIEVELLGGQKHYARVVHKDAKNDIALLKIDATNLTSVKFGDSDQVDLGEWVVGIGNPYGIGQSIMMGIVSAQRRLIPGSGYPPLIQIDAAMNLGNSGGPLFNMDGQVIGINTILLWKSQGIGFATPINSAKEFLERKNYTIVRAASGPAGGPLGPVADQPRSMENLNLPDQPGKTGR